MAKSSYKEQIKQAKFKDRNLTPLGALKREKNKVKNAYSVLGEITHPSSWFDLCVPNLLWGAIVITALDRENGLEIFRRVLQSAMKHVKRRRELFVTHNYLAVATPDEFDAMMEPILQSLVLSKVMPALLSVDWLPDRQHWARHYKTMDDEVAYAILMEAIGKTYFHQSQPATDMRWLKIMSMIFVQERMVFDKSFEERLAEISEYPNKGDMRKVRPSIRSMEMSTRLTEFGSEEMIKDWPADRPKLPEFDAEGFWREMHTKTHCLVPTEFRRADVGSKLALEEITKICVQIVDHFHSTSKTTAADPRHEGAFGLVLYACHLTMSTVRTPTNSLPEGRMILRTILEVFITLHYLTVKDDATIWLQYRKYGQGQSKLAFLKNIREEEIPDFIDLEALEDFANEDRWMELEDIELGHWANLNLRKMSEEVGLKDLYDKYYDWSSGYVHGQWSSTRSTVFINCFNPLHRFHRIPGPMASEMPSILTDVWKLLNRMLDDLNTLYPAFKPRLTWHKKTTEKDEDDASKTDQREISDGLLPMEAKGEID